MLLELQYRHTLFLNIRSIIKQIVLFFILKGGQKRSLDKNKEQSLGVSFNPMLKNGLLFPA